MQLCLVPLLSDWGLGKNGGLLPTSNAHCRYPSSVPYHILPIFDANNIVLSAPNIGRSLFELSVLFMSAIYTKVDNPCPSDLFAPVLYLLLITDLSAVRQCTARCVNFLLEQLVNILVNRASLPVTDGLIIHFADGPDGIRCRGDPDLIGVIQF